MPPPIHKEFITTLKEIDNDFDNVLIATYGFECGFFEDILLNVFQLKDASTIISLIDRSHYESTFKNAKNAGVSYFIEPISHRLFHPKFVLMTSESEGTLIISSANMTKNGLTEDAEIFTQIHYSDSAEDKTVISLFFEMKEFLNGLVNKGFIKSDKHTERLKKALQVPWLTQAPNIQQKRNDWILHNLDNSILNQTKEILSGTEVTTIKIFSPFFDLAGSVLKYISSNFSGQIELYLQPDRACNVPTEIINTLFEKENRIKVFKTSFKGNPYRFIHGKIMMFETGNGAYCLTGSANSTNDGLVLSSNNGNIELSLLQYAKDKNAFQYLLNNPELSIEQISSNELTPNIGGTSSNGVASDFDLEDARLEGNKLIIKFENAKDGFVKALVEIGSPSKTKTVPLKGSISKKGQFIENLSEETRRYCELSAYVTLTLSDDSDCKLVSNKRWISTEMLEKFPRKREIRLIKKTHGREGFITLLNRLDDAAADIPTMLLYYLKFLDFGSIAETLEEARKRFVQRTDEDEADTAQIYDGYVLDAKEVLETIISRNEKRFVELTEEVRVNQNLEESVREIFDFFIFIDKIVIWFILRKNTSPSNVLEIIERMKLLVGSNKRYWYYQDQIGYFRKLKGKIGDEDFLKIYDSLDVLPQFVLLSMIILKLVDSQPQERSFLKRHLTELLQNASFNGEEQSGLQSIPLEKMKKVIAEYKEFEIFSFSSKDIREINEMLKSPIKLELCTACKKPTRYRFNSEEFLCPDCAKRLLKRPGEYFVFTQCPKCDYRGWEKTQMKSSKPIRWCPRDGMRREETDAKFYLPV